jgi:hypothetical protein
MSEADTATVAKMIAAGLRFLCPGIAGAPQLCELRSLKFADGKRSRTAYFMLPGQADEMAAAALEMEEKHPKGIYWTINPVRGDMAEARASAKDEDMDRRRFFLIDIDPDREADTSSTDEEKDVAWRMVNLIADGLAAMGFARPIICDSANGYHLLYAIDLPNDEVHRVMLRALLYAIDERLGIAGAKIDKSVFNASRIARLYGTLARKGDDTPERPHRRSRILSSPPDVEATRARNNAAILATYSQLVQLEEMRTGRPDRTAEKVAKAEAKKPRPATGTPLGDDFDARATWLWILGPHGWKVDRVNSDGETHWTRPGKKDGTSATTGHCVGADGADLLHVFSDADQVAPLEPGRNYGKFRAYAILNHGGDYKLAAAALARLGYGTPAGLLAMDRQRHGELPEEALGPVIPATLAAPPEEDDSDVPFPMKASELMSKDFPEVVCVIDEILPVGLNLLAGRPKKGKSWLALLMALRVAAGESVLDRRAHQGDVYYMALEDSQRRIHSRIGQLRAQSNGGNGFPPGTLDRLCVSYSGDVRADDLRPIRKWARNVERPQLIIVDTLQKLRPPAKRSGDDYAADYAFLARLQEIAFVYNCAVLVIHHTRKVQSEDDPFVEVSGSTGLTGAPDTVLIMRLAAKSEEAKKGEPRDGTLFVTGRDIEEQNLDIRFQNGVWAIGGEGSRVKKRDTGKRDEAAEFILAYLRRAGQAVYWTDILAEIRRLDAAGQPAPNKDTTKNARDHLINTNAIRMDQQNGRQSLSLPLE